MKKRFADIPLETWEVALRRHGCRGRGEECGIDWGEVARTAFHLSGISVPFGPMPEDWAENMLPGELFEAAELATVGVSFPKSQHGDAVRVTVSAFPGGTVLGLRRDSWEGNDSLVFYLQTPSVEDLDSAARSAAEDALDGGDFAVYDADDDPPEEDDGIPAELYGFNQLRAAWGRRLRSLERRAPSSSGTVKRSKGARTAKPSRLKRS